METSQLPGDRSGRTLHNRRFSAGYGSMIFALSPVVLSIMGCGGENPGDAALGAGDPSEGKTTPEIGEQPQAVGGGIFDTSNYYKFVGWFETPAGGRCSGVLIASQWVLTSAHCIIFPEDGFQSCVNNNANIPPCPLCLDATVDVNFTQDENQWPVPANLTRRHTKAASGQLKILADGAGPINNCTNDGTARDLALIRLDEPMQFDDVLPIHLPHFGMAKCAEAVSNNDNFRGTVVGYGKVGSSTFPGNAVNYRNYNTSYNWDLESMGGGRFVYRNRWDSPLTPYQGPLPGDSGGAMMTFDVYTDDFNSLRPLLCGINSRYYPTASPYPPFVGVGASAANVDIQQPASDFIGQNVVRPNNPYGRPDSNWEGEPLPRSDQFVISGDNKLYHRWTDKYIVEHGWELAGPGNYGVPLVSEPSAVSWSKNRIDVFVKANDGYIDHAYSDNGVNFGWDSWGNPAPAGFTGTPKVSSLRPGQLDVFVSGSPYFGRGFTPLYHIFHINYDNGSSVGWEDWGTPPPGLSGANAKAESIATVAGGLGPNRLDIFVLNDTGTYKKIMHAYTDTGRPPLAWDDWGYPGDAVLTGPIDAASWGPGRYDLFTTDSNGNLRQLAWQWGLYPWYNWGHPPSELATGISVVSMGPNSLRILTIGQSTRKTWQRTWHFGDRGWKDYDGWALGAADASSWGW